MQRTCVWEQAVGKLGEALLSSLSVAGLATKQDCAGLVAGLFPRGYCPR